MRKFITARRSRSGKACFAAAVVVAAGCLAAGRAWGQQFSDDFNRANGTNPGPNWVERAGEIFIANNRVRPLPGTTSLMTVANFSTTDPVLSIDAIHTPVPNSFSYVALVGRYADLSNNVFVKVQSDPLTVAPMFEKLFFYYGANEAAWAGMTGGGAIQNITPFSSGRLTVSVTGSTVTASIDTNFDGTPDQTFTRGGLPLANLGTGVGLGLGSDDEHTVDADNFSALAGTLRITSITKPSANQILLNGKGVPGVSYVIKANTDLSQSFQTLGNTSVTDANGDWFCEDVLLPGVTNRFYRAFPP